MPKYLLAIDQGTTSTRAILFSSEDASRVASHQIELRQYYPQPGWVEHDPLEIAESVRACVRSVYEQAVARGGVALEDVASVGITNQRETTVVWDRATGKPLHNAIVWLDSRTRDTCAQLAAGAGEDRFRAKTGLPISTYFAGVKLKWLADNVSGLRQALESGSAVFGTIDSWLVYNLTAERAHVTDVTNAGRTMLMDLRAQRWDDELCAAFGVPRRCLPEIRSSAEVYGTLAGTQCPFDGRVPVASILGDQHAAMVGQACFDAGSAKNTYGTGCFLMMHTGSEPVFSSHGLLTTPAYQLGKHAPVRYALEGSVAIAGAGVQWLRDNLRIIDSAAESEALARSVDDTGDVYFVPAFTGLFAPRWRSDARGTLVGMTQYTTRAHIVRAMLEQVCFMSAEVLRAAQGDMRAPLTVLRVDGGMTANELMLQLQADLLGVQVTRPRVTETTALGAATAAALAVGVYKDVEEVRALWREDCSFSPRISKGERERRQERWGEAVERSLGWAK